MAHDNDNGGTLDQIGGVVLLLHKQALLDGDMDLMLDLGVELLIMICVGIYAVLINNMIIAANIHSALFSVAAYTVILCFSLFKTGSLAKSIFHAH